MKWLALIFIAGALPCFAADPVNTKTNKQVMVQVRFVDDKGQPKAVESVPKVVKTDEEWTKQLSRRFAARFTTIISRAFITASAAACRCSRRKRSSIQARVGRVSSSRS